MSSIILPTKKPSIHVGINTPSTLSNTDSFAVTHMSMELTADFDNKSLKGNVTLSCVATQDDVNSITLDSRALIVTSVSVDGDSVEFAMGSESEAFGVPLEITLAGAWAKDSEHAVVVEYSTTEDAPAIQWLSPDQTAGKKHPYLFTQCQAIHARSMVPCQDTPGRKITYDAKITVPGPLVALMSAISTGDATNEDGSITYNFQQEVPIPTYLIALAIGALESRDIGPRSKVWSEAETVDAGAYEFEDTEKFIAIGEDLLNPYAWGKYDVLLLPPSFPYGGMENPTLTFVTPTLIAGDKSLANVVAHEIAHSWMGNLITNRTWEHFWLNEGNTVFIERKILGRMHGEQMRHLSALTGWKALKDSVAYFGDDSPLTALVPNLEGIDPDDAFSSVPYEKGFNLLFYLEGLVGGADAFEPFLKTYVEQFKYDTVTTEEWKQSFLDFFKDSVDAEKLDSIDWDTWFNSPGMPPVTPEFDTTLADAADALAKVWIENGGENTAAGDIEGWHVEQLIHFLNGLIDGTEEKPLSLDTLKKLNETYSLDGYKNSEIRFRYAKLAIMSEHEDHFPAIVEFLLEQGRMKFVRPLYRSLFASEKGKQLAIDTFQANKSIYHGIAQKMVAKDLEL